MPIRTVAGVVLVDLSEHNGRNHPNDLRQCGGAHHVSYAYPGQNGTRVNMNGNNCLPFHGTASGLCLFGCGEAEEPDAQLAQPLEAHTPLTETDPERFRTLLARIQTQSWAEYISCHEANLHSFSCPFCDAQRHYFDALTLAMLSA